LRDEHIFKIYICSLASARDAGKKNTKNYDMVSFKIELKNSDSTELGTNYSSVKCTKCPPGKGFMSSTEPLKGADAIWKCDGCGEQQPYRECSVGVECQIVSEIQAAESEEELEKVLESHAGVTVHPNHYLMMDARQEIVKR
jgi:hypothetical protein